MRSTGSGLPPATTESTSSPFMTVPGSAARKASPSAYSFSSIPFASSQVRTWILPASRRFSRTKFLISSRNSRCHFLAEGNGPDSRSSRYIT